MSTLKEKKFFKDLSLIANRKFKSLLAIKMANQIKRQISMENMFNKDPSMKRPVNFKIKNNLITFTGPKQKRPSINDVKAATAALGMNKKGSLRSESRRDSGKREDRPKTRLKFDFNSLPKADNLSYKGDKGKRVFLRGDKKHQNAKRALMKAVKLK